MSGADSRPLRMPENSSVQMATTVNVASSSWVTLKRRLATPLGLPVLAPAHDQQPGRDQGEHPPGLRRQSQAQQQPVDEAQRRELRTSEQPGDGDEHHQLAPVEERRTDTRAVCEQRPARGGQLHQRGDVAGRRSQVDSRRPRSEADGARLFPVHLHEVTAGRQCQRQLALLRPQLHRLVVEAHRGHARLGRKLHDVPPALRAAVLEATARCSPNACPRRCCNAPNRWPASCPRRPWAATRAPRVFRRAVG